MTYITKQTLPRYQNWPWQLPQSPLRFCSRKKSNIKFTAGHFHPGSRLDFYASDKKSFVCTGTDLNNSTKFVIIIHLIYALNIDFSWGFYLYDAHWVVFTSRGYAPPIKPSFSILDLKSYLIREMRRNSYYLECSRHFNFCCKGMASARMYFALVWRNMTKSPKLVTVSNL